MAKSLVAVLALLTVASTSVHAQEVPDDVVGVATEAGVDPVDLQGALVSQGLHDARTYLRSVGELPQPVVSGRQLYVKLTYYTYNSGVTANGGSVYSGSTACSFNFPFGSRFKMPDGSVVTCNDRGLLYYNPNSFDGWLDVYNRPDIGRLGAGVVLELN